MKKKPTETLRLLLVAVMQQAENEGQHETFYAIRAIYRETYGEDSTF